LADLMTVYTCKLCGKPVDTEHDPYGVVWHLPWVSFAHVACMENSPDVTDISEEIAGYKREAIEQREAIERENDETE
jgi:hypothetical protein